MPAEWVGSRTPCGLCLHFTLIRFIVSINIIVWIQLCNQSYDNHNLVSYFSFLFSDSATLKSVMLVSTHKQPQPVQTDVHDAHPNRDDTDGGRMM